MKPIPRREDFWTECMGYDGSYTIIDETAYERARADWMMETLVPLLRRWAMTYDGDCVTYLGDCTDAVLRELEGEK